MCAWLHPTCAMTHVPWRIDIRVIHVRIREIYVHVTPFCVCHDPYTYRRLMCSTYVWYMCMWLYLSGAMTDCFTYVWHICTIVWCMCRLLYLLCEMTQRSLCDTYAHLCDTYAHLRALDSVICVTKDRVTKNGLCHKRHKRQTVSQKTKKIECHKRQTLSQKTESRTHKCAYVSHEFTKDRLCHKRQSCVLLTLSFVCHNSFTYVSHMCIHVSRMCTYVSDMCDTHLYR